MSPDIITPGALAERLRLARRARGISQDQLAALADIPQSQVSRLEGAKITQPSLNDVLNVAHALSVSLDALVSPDGSSKLVAELADDTSEPAQERRAAPVDLNAPAIETIRGIGRLDLVESVQEWIADQVNVAVYGSPAGRERLLEAVGALADHPALGPAAPVAAAHADRGAIAPDDRPRSVRRTAEGHQCDVAVADASAATLRDLLDELSTGWFGVWMNVAAADLDRAMEMITLACRGQRSLPSHVHVLLDADVGTAHQVVLDARRRVTLAPLHDGGRRIMSLLPVAGAHTDEPPAALVIDDPDNPPAGMIPIGHVPAPEGQRGAALAVHVDALRLGLYACGTTGAGKSTLLEHLAVGLACNRRSTVMIDPHGVSADNVLVGALRRDPSVAERLLLVDFSDPGHVTPANPFDVRGTDEVDAAVGAFRAGLLRTLNLAPDSTPRAVVLAEYAAAALCEANVLVAGRGDARFTIADIPAFFCDADVRELVVAASTNPLVRATFGQETGYGSFGERQQIDMVMPVLRAVDALTAGGAVGRALTQPRNALRFARWADEGRCLLVKLCSWSARQAALPFLASMIVPALAARAANGQSPRDVFVVCDELQSIADENVARALTSAGRIGMHIIGANQVPADLPPNVLRAVQANTLSKVSFRLDPTSVGPLRDALAGGGTTPSLEDIAAQRHWSAWANLQTDDRQPTGPFRFDLLPPVSDRPLTGAEARDHRAATDDVLRRSRRELAAETAAGEPVDPSDNRARVLEALREHVRGKSRASSGSW